MRRFILNFACTKCWNQVAVAIRIVYAGYIHTELAVVQPFQREGGLRAGIRVFPLVGGPLVFRMRGVLLDVVLLRSLAFLHLLDLVPDTFHYLYETIQLGLALALGRRYLLGAVYRER